MLRFQTPLTAAAREIIVYCLEVAADEILDGYEDHEAWAAAYPLSSMCFTPDLARKVLLDLLEKLEAPELYVPTDYHWLLMYKCLKEQIALFNDEPVPSVVKRLRTLVTEQDTPYVRLGSRSTGTAGVAIDFDQFIDVYLWDTDFLTDSQMFSDLTPEAKRQLGFSGEVFGVIHRLTPHPDELVMRQWQEGRANAAEGQESSEEV
jgi:hypothetical protein